VFLCLAKLPPHLRSYPQTAGAAVSLFLTDFLSICLYLVLLGWMKLGWHPVKILLVLHGLLVRGLMLQLGLGQLGSHEKLGLSLQLGLVFLGFLVVAGLVPSGQKLLALVPV